MTNCSTVDTGIVFQRSTIKMQQITDGTTHTYLFGEKNLDPNYYETGEARNDDQSMYTGHDMDNIRSTLIRALPNGTLVGWPAAPDAPGTGETYRWSFGGPHSGGWQVVFCDGSVHFITYELDAMIHRWLGNRQDGNVVDMGQL
jgi:prepilin-type processing-associated H-X9-DG protein